MAAATLPDFYRGDTVQHTLTVTENGAALNLTGASITLSMKRSTEQADADAAVSIAAVVTNAVGGIATITIPATTTAALTPGKYHWDIQVKKSTGEIGTAAGTVTVKPDVTRAT